MANDTAVGQYTGPMLGFDDRFNAALPLFIDPTDPMYAGILAGSRQQAMRNLATMMPAGQPPIYGPQRPTNQQPSIPINTTQGAPPQEVATAGPQQALTTAPNSGVVGPSAYPPNMALTNGSGMPIGGLPTQSPAPTYSFNQMPIAGPANPQVRMQNHIQNLQSFQKFLAQLRGRYSGQA